MDVWTLMVDWFGLEHSVGNVPRLEYIEKTRRFKMRRACQVVESKTRSVLTQTDQKVFHQDLGRYKYGQRKNCSRLTKAKTSPR